MTKIAVPPGTGLRQAQRRLHGRGFGLPALLSDGASAVTSARAGVTFVGSGTPHTQGTWVEIVAALSADVGFVRITPTANTTTANTDSSALFNLGIGAAASEVVILDSLGVGWHAASGATLHPGWTFPIFIPRGTRVAGQVQGAEASKSTSFRFDFFSPVDGLIASSKVIALGAVTASSRGPVLATPAGNNTEGAWTEIIASTAEAYTALGVSIQGGGDNNQGSANALVDIARGASGSEVAIISDLYVSILSTEGVEPVSPLVHPATVAPGTRLSARLQVGSTASSLDVILHGIRNAA